MSDLILGLFPFISPRFSRRETHLAVMLCFASACMHANYTRSLFGSLAPDDDEQTADVSDDARHSFFAVTRLHFLLFFVHIHFLTRETPIPL